MCNAPIEKIFNTLRRFYRSRHLSHWDAEDMTQDVMCKLLSMGRPPEQEQQAYIYTVARTLLIDKYRSDTRKKTMAHSSFEEEDMLYAADSSPELELFASRLSILLQQRFDALTNLQQQTFMDCKIKGKQLKDVATERGVSVSAVEKIVRKVRTKMLEPIPAGEDDKPSVLCNSQ